jgi:sulfate permease, SulP family
VSAWSEARAGLHAGALAAAQTLTHGMIVFAALGAAGVAFGIAGAFAASALAGMAIALFGASRPLVGTTTAATALVAASVVAAAAPATLGEAVLLAVLLTGGAGLLMLLFAGVGFSRLAALVPTPVSQGLGNAIALLAILSQLPLVLGAAPGAGGAAVVPGALLVAAVALVLMLRPLPGLPAPLLALGAAGLLHHLLSATGVATGPMVAIAPTPEILAAGLAAAFAAPLPMLSLDRLLPAMASLALLASVEALTAASALREASGRRADYDRDLRGAGLAMLGGAAVGGVPTSGLTVPTMACWRAGGRGRAAQFWRAGVALIVLLVAGPLVALLPFAALAGVLCGAVLRLVQLPASPLRAGIGRARRAGDALVVLAVMGAALAFGLVVAVGVGVLLSIVIFTASMAVTPIRRVTRNPVGRSRIRRPSEQERALRRSGEAIALLELEGAIFFGSAERVLQQAEAEYAAGATVLILDMARVTRIDLSGGRRLIEVCRVAPGRVLLAPLHEGARARTELEALGLFSRLPEGAVRADLPAAVEAAEALILADTSADQVPPPGSPRAGLAALGLPPAVVAPLLALCTEQRFAAGSLILRQGDAADAAYVLLAGEVLISLPAGPARPATRLAVLAPGIVFGEAALLGQTTRSADATARSDVHCLRLDAGAVERLRIEAPSVAWHLMAMVARQLATHVSAANAVIDRLEA